MNAFIRLLYALLIAVAVAAFVGTGIYSFYSPPKGPEFPSRITSEQEYQQERDDYHDEQERLKPVREGYYRNVSIIVALLAAAAVASGLILLSKFEVIGEGIALGGLATSAYGTITASMANQRTLLFVSVTILLAGALLLAHKKFFAPAPKKR